jgi:hypothetical protein
MIVKVLTVWFPFTRSKSVEWFACSEVAAIAVAGWVAAAATQAIKN